jgi:galacturan 1,4-alpha-galacturonidase
MIMAFGKNARRVLLVLMVMCATSTAKRPAAKEGAAPAPAPEAGASEASGATGIFDITNVGATSDGKTDCSKVISREASLERNKAMFWSI